MQAPRLGEDVVVLRALTPGDVDDLVELGQDDELQRWEPAVPSPYRYQDALEDVARAARGWERGDLMVFAVEHERRCAGTVTLSPDAAGGAGLQYALAAWARGRGVAAAAVRLALVWGFTELGLDVVHWRARVGAWRARRVAWACGVTVEGTVRSLLVAGGQRYDAWVGTVRWDDPLRPRTPWLAPLALEGGAPRVRLDALELGDVERVAEACNDPTTRAWLPELPSPYTVADAVAFVSSRDDEHAAARGVYWAVREHAGAPLVATVGLFRLTPGGRAGELGYWSHPEARGRRLMTSAVVVASAHALTTAERGGLGLTRVAVRASRENRASRAVAVRAGFTETGVERSAERLRDGTVSDFVCYDLLPTETGRSTPSGPPGDARRRRRR